MIFICFGQDSWQCNSDSIHLDFTMLRFDSDSIQHILDSIQTQFTSASSVIDSTQNSQKMLNWIGIDSESELIHTSLLNMPKLTLWTFCLTTLMNLIFLNFYGRNSALSSPTSRGDDCRLPGISSSHTYAPVCIQHCITMGYII